MLVAVAAFAAVWFAMGRRSGAPRPNVLVLVMDTTRGDRCSFNGYQRPTTPQIDAFAKDGVVFRDAWSPSGWTAPAHAALFTGRRPEHVGLSTGGRLFLGTGFPTLAETLADAGWSTACFSNNELIAPEFGFTRGFANVEPLFARAARTYPWAPQTHDLAATWAEAEARDGRPFFLFINDMEPHMPYTPPAEDERRFVRGDPTPDELAAARAFDFAGAVRYSLRANEATPRQIATLDRAIGGLLDRLRADGLLDSTIVVICGDHGEMLGEHHLLEHGYTLYRAARHVPLVVRAPGAFTGGRSVADTVRLEDVMPTLLELCGVDVPPGVDGVSLSRGLGGRVSTASQGPNADAKARIEKSFPGVDATLFDTGIDAAYDGRYHYVAFSDGRIELYDVSRDPEEKENLAAARPDDVARLKSLLVR
jgi:arylsulfatase A-like enzyme